MRVLLNGDGLDEAKLPQVSLVVLIRVNHLILDNHYELIDMIAECLCNLISQVADCLIVIHLNVVTDVIWP